MKGLVINHGDIKVTSSLVMSYEFGVKHKVVLSLIETMLPTLSKNKKIIIKLVQQNLKPKGQNKMYLLNEYAFYAVADFFSSEIFTNAKNRVKAGFNGTAKGI